MVLDIGSDSRDGNSPHVIVSCNMEQSSRDESSTGYARHRCHHHRTLAYMDGSDILEACYSAIE